MLQTGTNGKLVDRLLDRFFYESMNHQNAVTNIFQFPNKYLSSKWHFDGAGT